MNTPSILVMMDRGRKREREEGVRGRTGQSCYEQPGGQAGAGKLTASLCTFTYGCEVITAMSHGQRVKTNRSSQSVEWTTEDTHHINSAPPCTCHPDWKRQ